MRHAIALLVLATLAACGREDDWPNAERKEPCSYDRTACVDSPAALCVTNGWMRANAEHLILPGDPIPDPSRDEWAEVAAAVRRGEQEYWCKCGAPGCPCTEANCKEDLR